MENTENLKKFIPIICTKCKKVPKLTIKGIVPEDLTIICPCGERSTSISNYLSELRKNTSANIEERADISHYFCEDCQIHIRTLKPGPEHANHKLVDLSKIVSPETLKQISKAKLKAMDILKVYCGEIIKKMKEEFEIAMKKLNEVYCENMKINAAYLDLVNLLEQNCDFNNPNYFSFKNFIENSEILLPEEPYPNDFTIKDYDRVLEYIKYFNFNGKHLPEKEQPPLIKQGQSVPPKEVENKLDDLKNKLKKDLKIDTIEEVSMITSLQDNRLAIGTEEGDIIIYDVATNKECFTISEHTNEILWLSVYDDKLFSTSLDDKVNIYEIFHDNYNLIDSFIPFKDDDLRLVFGMSDDRFLVTSEVNFSIWKIGDHSEELNLYRDVDNNLEYAYPVNGENTVVTLGEEKILKWDLTKTEPVGNLPFTYPIICLTSTKDNKLIIGTKGLILIIDVLALEIKREIKNEMLSQQPFDLCSLNNDLLVIVQNNNIYALHLKTEKIETIREKAHKAKICIIISSPNNKFLTLDKESLIKQWSI